jgi:hypothetical protein
LYSVNPISRFLFTVANSVFIVGKKVLAVLKEYFNGQEATNVNEWTNDEVYKASQFLKGKCGPGLAK